MKRIILLLLLLCSCSKKYELDDIKAYNLPISIKRGFNLGNSLECASKDYGYTLDTEEFWYNPKTDKKLIDFIADSGFDCIRVPVSYLNHVDDKLNIDPKWLDRVEEVVNYCLDNNLYTIINIHHDTGMNPSLNWIYADADDYYNNRDKYIFLWKQIGERFKDYDERLLFQGSGEWMNPERNFNRSDSYEDFKIVHDLNQDFINTIREIGFNNTDRYLMISAFAASAEIDILESMFYKEYEDVADNRLIISAHTYDSDVDNIYTQAKRIVEISNRYKMPIVIDEFGVSIKNNRKRNIDVIKSFSKISDNYNIPLIIWDDGYEYKIIDRNNYKISDNEIYDILFDK